MADSSSELLTCSKCGTQFPRANPLGRKPKYCDPCYVKVSRKQGDEVARERARQRMAARRTPPVMDAVCVDCSATFRRESALGTPSKRCPPCKYAHLRSNARANYEKRRDAAKLDRQNRPKEVRWANCKDCGAPVRCSIGSRAKSRCDDCRRKHAREYWWSNYRGDDPDPIQCVDCKTWLSVSRKGHRKLRCTPCRIKWRQAKAQRWTRDNRERRREQYYRREIRRRALRRTAKIETFARVEIYTRDKWICQICRTRIGKRLKFPHPRSATIDHIIPVSEGGDHTRSNCRAAHLICNVRRSNRGGGEQLALIG